MKEWFDTCRKKKKIGIDLKSPISSKGLDICASNKKYGFELSGIEGNNSYSWPVLVFDESFVLFLKFFVLRVEINVSSSMQASVYSSM